MKFGGIEFRRLAFENVLGEGKHVLRDLDVANVVEIDPFVPHLVRISERRAEQALSPRLKHDHTLALGEDHAPKRDHALVAHRVADHRERLERDLVLGDQIIGAVDKALVDLGFRHETVDVDRMAALDRDGVELFVLDLQVDALVDFVAPALVIGVDRVARRFVDQLLAQAIAGLLVDLAEGHPLARRRRACRARSDTKRGKA